MLRLAQCLLLASVLLGGESYSINAASQYEFPMPQDDLPQQVLIEEDIPMQPMKAALPLKGTKIPQQERDTWVVKCSSEQPGNDCNKATDGSTTTFWQTRTGTGGTQRPDPLPHTITIDLQIIKSVNAVYMTPLNTSLDGAVSGHIIWLSLDNIIWTGPVAFGTWFEDVEDKNAIFEPQLARFVRLQAITASRGTQFIRIADLGVYASAASTAPPPQPSLGIWGPTVNFPIVPVGVFIDPVSGNVVSFSTFTKDTFSGNGGKDGTTWTATWNRTSGIVSPALVNTLNHDMFCPGMAFDVNGNMVITGGKSASKTSFYNSADGTWRSAGDMGIARGYQGSTTVGDGRIFVIGGSWAGGPEGKRNGEIYDPKTNKWSPLTGCPVKSLPSNQSPVSILTNDWNGEYRGDNHVWLLSWKNNSIFHAGPSNMTHWITTAGQGAIVNASLRGTPTFTDSDAMNGVAAMYDAAAGKILTAGGSSSYKYRNDSNAIVGDKATANAFVITLNEVNKPVRVDTASNGLRFPRTMHHAVILPNGDTFVVGGQIEGQPWSEDTPQLIPEIYRPGPNIWQNAAPHSIIRVYHSFGLLLPDATVLVGGGGVCGDCLANHFDAQVYIPAYLLTATGTRAVRPVILRTSTPSVKPGNSFTFTTDTEIVAASLVRYGGATHSLNNDQRRIELKPQRSALPQFQYTVVVPSDGGVALPGFWMLFAINALGVPSESKNVQVLVA